jgi:hypothetical protein
MKEILLGLENIRQFEEDDDGEEQPPEAPQNRLRWWKQQVHCGKRSQP